ncbi:glycine zipper 2TM domain-containing protein [Microbulbifer sp. HZ11]|uniref:glycine zipper 2TM domain-containing protein n=1 Tax=Microbulbifer sp. HZ11 TaxID=1453501 RepID=UPI0005B7CE9A|nr:membrane protein [Microbulbifer sp. HZ11]
MATVNNWLQQLAFAGLTAALVGVSVSATAGESGYPEPYEGQYVGQQGYHYATVTGVTPIYNDIRVVEPRTQCWDQTVTYQQPSPAGAIIGGLVGAAVGRNVVKGHKHRNYRHYGRHHYRHHHRANKGAGMVAGAAVGAIIGSAISRHQAPVQYGTEQRCQVVEEVSTRRELIGYDVNYRYNGQEYLIRTDHHPGDRIRVRVDVTPVL